MTVKFRLILFFLVTFWGSITVVATAVNFILHPLSFFYQKKREVQPEILQDPAYGTHKYITANGIKFHYVANGTEGKPLMLFIHGFPEFWFTWRFQLLHFCKDYYAVAIDLRGYGDTDKPVHKKDYKIDTIAQDIAELIPALGYKSCVLVAHDWGGILAWQLAQNHPELVDHLIMMNSSSYDIYMKFVFSNLKQFLLSWYIFMLQLPYLPELLMTARDFNVLDQAFFSNSTGLKNQQNVSKEVLEAFKYSFSQKGVWTAAVNYYRNLFNTENHCHDRKIDLPVLFIWGDEDTALSKELPDSHDVMATDLVVKHIPNCSHWTQLDYPNLVNQYMQEFLQNHKNVS